MVMVYYKSLVEKFYKVYLFSAFADRDEVVRFRDQKMKGQGHNETTYG